ncbi:MAG: altronate dehydratase [Anaerolineae bacterium]|nr:altronate dehydratase [Anaerolineae bacterium]
MHSVTLPLDQVAVRLHPADDVAIAKADLAAGTVVLLDEARATLWQPIPSGHKLALRAIAQGAPVRRYGQVIGVARRPIAPGEHVHTHNLGLDDAGREAAVAAHVPPVDLVPEAERRTFMGYARPDGRAGTRNLVAVIATVNCAAHVVQAIAHHFTPQRLAPYVHVDGVVPFTHAFGCALPADGRDYAVLQRTLAGVACHPNVGAALLVGLGCEVNQVSDQARGCGLCAMPMDRPGLVIQDQGGIQATVQAGIEAVAALLPQVDAARRTPQPLSRLTVALQCGGSDGWSGVTANPAVGLVSDALVRQGGTVVLGETPEITGAEHLLAARAATPEVARQLLAQVRWWEAYARRMGIQLDDNRSVGNAAGGLTTIYEKSLGAVAKAGSTPLVAVYDYAEAVAARGVTFMNTPGYDPVSVTGQVAGGCTLVLFTTGRGSVFGFKLAPSIKISTTTALYERMRGDIDVDAGRVLAGARLEDVAAEVFDLALAVASGRPSKSEAQGVGEAEFVPWQTVGTL